MACLTCSKSVSIPTGFTSKTTNDFSLVNFASLWTWCFWSWCWQVWVHSYSVTLVPLWPCLSSWCWQVWAHSCFYSDIFLLFKWLTKILLLSSKFCSHL
jgi:hypothetical protein